MAFPSFSVTFAFMETAKKIANTSSKIFVSLFLGGAILYWMYRDFDFSQIEGVLLHGMNWTWMLLSFPFGILAQMIRGWRWRQALEPVGEHSRKSVAVNAIFLSYAASLVVPRIGEFTRCAVLKRYDDVSFSKALGTVVTERVIDSLLVMIITGLTLILEIRVFDIFFARTGTRLDTFFTQFSLTGWMPHGLDRHYHLWHCGHWAGVVSRQAIVGAQQDKGHASRYVLGRVEPEAGQQCTALRVLDIGYLGLLFPALLLDVLLFRRYERIRSRLRHRDIHCRKHCRDCAHSQRCWSLAFRREDHAYPLRSELHRCTVFCADRAFRADAARRAAGHLGLGRTELHGSQEAGRTGRGTLRKTN